MMKVSEVHSSVVFKAGICSTRALIEEPLYIHTYLPALQPGNHH